jgi:hypothetical protein
LQQKPLYAAVAKASFSPSSPTTTVIKPVPGRHKREIIVSREGHTDIRTNHELIEQLNNTERRGQVVAVRGLPSGDLILTTDDEQTRAEWLRNTEWLRVVGDNARIKKREFIVIAHRIRVNQVQDQERAKEEIYRQNPKLRGNVEILQLTWKKKLLRSGRTTGPLHISVAEPEQANTLIDSGLIWNCQLHDCEPFLGECLVT